MTEQPEAVELEPMTEAELDGITKRIIAAREGKGEMPGPDELKRAYVAIRSMRSRSTSPKNKKVKQVLPDNLDDLFSD